jgi:hypothetical protein
MANLTIFISKIGEKKSLKLTKISCFQKRNSEKNSPCYEVSPQKRKHLKARNRQPKYRFHTTGQQNQSPLKLEDRV